MWMTRQDPFAQYRFHVEIDGLAVAHFQAVSGLNSELEVLAQQEGGRNSHLVKLPGQGQLGALTLKRGWGGDRAFFEWMREARELGVSGRAVRRNVDVVLLADDARTELGRYTLFRAWPSKWVSEDFATENGQAIESLELAHEGLRHSAGAGAGAGGPAVPGGGGAPGLGDRLRDAARAAGRRPSAGRTAAQAARDARHGLADRATDVIDDGRAALDQARSALQSAADAALQNPAEQAWARLRSQLPSAPSSALAVASAARRALAEGSPLPPAPPAPPSVAGSPAPSQAARSAAAAAGLPSSVPSPPRPPGLGFARTGAPPTSGAPVAGAWSDGVAVTQAPSGFGEPPLQRGGSFGV